MENRTMLNVHLYRNLNQTPLQFMRKGKSRRYNVVSCANKKKKNCSAKQMLFCTKLRLKSGQVLGEFVPVLWVQAKCHILHKLVKA